jgi:(E)-4-hydroxy-3-methylbut-2-enyl-diphosphate synthase
MPLCADIHFDYRIALRCLDFPIAKLRINPGNIGRKNRVEAVLSKAAAKKVPVRIGVNAGSLPPALREKLEDGRLGRAEALAGAALEEAAAFEKFGFTNFVVSMKASGIADTIKANRLFRRRSAAPLHIGVTEAGPLVAGSVRSAAALLPLLADGIGDTLRVSLSDTMENEVIAAREILSAAAEAGCTRARRGVLIISCPLCGRNGFDTHAFTGRWMKRLYELEKPLSIAVMGCAVNGPGEAKHADLGITGAGNKVLIFRHGKVLRTIDANDADRAFEEELRKL